MKSILLIGLGRFGKHVAKELDQWGHQVMAVDIDEGKVNEVMPYVANAYIGDSTNEEFLASLGVEDFDICIVAIGSDFQSSLETTSLLKEAGAEMVVSRATRQVQEKFLLRNGADDVVYPEKDMAKWTAIRYGVDHILDYIEMDEDYGIFEVVVPDDWIGDGIDREKIRRKYGITIMALKHSGKLNVDFDGETFFAEKDILIVLGKYKEVQRCFRL